LPADHPLRRLLKPHIFSAAQVQMTAIKILAAQGGIAERLWPFTFEGLATLLKQGIETAPFEPFPTRLKSSGLANLSDEMYPFATDALALHNICRDYVENYVEIYFPGESIVSDPAVQAWWKQLETSAAGSGLGTLQTRKQVVDLAAQIIFAVSGWHSHVGANTKYLSDPSFLGAKVRAGSELADIQSTILIYSLNAVTGFNQPKLLDDFTHVYLDLHKEKAVEVFQQFQKSLIALGHDIDSRNESRSMPLRTFHPAVLDTAVSK
jgi:arachidonate 15-lipoxygenase